MKITDWIASRVSFFPCGILALAMTWLIASRSVLYHLARNARILARNFFAWQGAGRRRSRQLRRLEGGAATRKKYRRELAFVAGWYSIHGETCLRYRVVCGPAPSLRASAAHKTNTKQREATQLVVLKQPLSPFNAATKPAQSYVVDIARSTAPAPLKEQNPLRISSSACGRGNGVENGHIPWVFWRSSSIIIIYTCLSPLAFVVMITNIP